MENQIKKKQRRALLLKKVFKLKLYLLILLFCIPAYTIQQNQAAHFAASFALSQAIGRAACQISPQDKWACFIVPTITALFVGGMYEFFNPSRDSFDDMIWNAAGSTSGAGFNLLFEF